MLLAIDIVVMACDIIRCVKIALRQGWIVVQVKVYTYLITPVFFTHVGRC